LNESGIPSARLKLARAQKHLRALDRAVKKFRRERPYEFAFDNIPNDRNKPDFYIRAIVTAAPPIPDTWALMTGDVLTNARAALDHAIFPHVSANRPTLEPQDIQYPICDRRAQFDNQARRFSRPVLKHVRASQPYHHQEPGGHPLAVLRDLVNVDKHRNLVIAQYAVGEFTVQPQPFFEVLDDVELQDGPLAVGDVACVAHCRLTGPMKGRLIQLATEVAYSESISLPGSDDPLDLISLLKHVLGPLGSMLDELEEAGC
jgi:hypothetical protein